PAIFATALGTSVGTYLFLGSAAGQNLFEPANIGRTVLFVMIGCSIAVIGGRLRMSRQTLAAAVRDLRASNRTKDNALATLAHEIRNPLSALKSANEVLSRGPTSPDATRKMSEVISRQVAQMTRLAADLLDVSSVMRREVHLEKRPIDLRNVLEQAVEQAAPLMRTKGHQLHQHLGSGGATEVIGDEQRLVQVFANVLTNAAKYTNRDGEIRLELQSDSREALVVVSDNGVGMDPDSIGDMFEAFVQAPSAVANPEGGLGIGLALVQNIVELHGGRVKAESGGLGCGSTFRIWLPRAAAMSGSGRKAA
ncbi:MAG: Chemotaxis protein methyltransferase CheR, partial [uncultured Ramlibacter sp.]